MGNYEALGKHLKIVDNRNSELISDRVLGINIDKYFIPSVANVIGTDLSNYKLLRKGLFACNPMHVGRDGRLPVALYTENEPAIVSPAYFMFEISDPDVLNPEYLMMWFRRPEFDRLCWLKTDGSVRGGITWDDICRLEIPIIPMEKQLYIVKNFSIITKRIELKQKINDNLTETGVSLLSKEIGTAAIINKTPDEISSLNIPDSWEVMPVSEYCLETKSGATPSRDITEYWENGTVPWLKSGEVHNGITIETEEFITELAVNNSSTKVLPSDTVLMAMYGVTAGEVGYLAIPCTTNQAVCGMVCRTKVESAYLFFALLQNQQEASRLSNGGAQDNLSKGFIDNILIVVPNRDVLSNLGLTTLINQIKQNTKEILLLTTMQDTLLAQLSSR